MSEISTEFADLRNLIASEGTAVTPEDIDVYSKFQDTRNQTAKVNAVLSTWTQQEEHYRKARKVYANWIVGALLIQGVLVNIAFFLIGTEKIVVEPWVANSFILGVFGEMATLSLIVFKYFFPSSPSKLAALVEKL